MDNVKNFTKRYQNLNLQPQKYFWKVESVSFCFLKKSYSRILKNLSMKLLFKSTYNKNKNLFILFNKRIISITIKGNRYNNCTK